MLRNLYLLSTRSSLSGSLCASYRILLIPASKPACNHMHVKYGHFGMSLRLQKPRAWKNDVVATFTRLCLTRPQLTVLITDEVKSRDGSHSTEPPRSALSNSSLLYYDSRVLQYAVIAIGRPGRQGMRCSFQWAAGLVDKV